MSRNVTIVVALVGACVAARCLAWSAEHVIHKDGARFIRVARLIEEGRWDEALTVHPPLPILYPLTIVGLHKLGLPWLLAARIPPILLGSLGVIPLFLLATAAWNRRVGIVTGAIYALSPELVRLQAWMMSEGPFLFFFLWAMALTYFAVERESWWMGALAGLAGVGAYHTRPEGIYALAGLVGWTGLAMIGKRRILWKAALACLLGLILYAAIAFPYVDWVHDHTGRWRAFATDLPDQLMAFYLRGEEPGHVSENPQDREAELRRDYGRLGGTLIFMGDSILRMNFYVLLPLTIAGIIAVKRGLTKLSAVILLAVFAIGYLIPPTLYLYAGMETARRYFLPPFVIAMPFAAVATLLLIDAFRWGKYIAVALVLAGLGGALLPMRQDHAGIRDAGLWLRDHAEGDVIFASDRRIEAYSGYWIVDDPSTARWIVLPVDDARYEEVRARYRFRERFGEDDEVVEIFSSD